MVEFTQLTGPLFSIMAVTVWKGLGYMVIYLAGLLDPT